MTSLAYSTLKTLPGLLCLCLQLPALMMSSECSARIFITAAAGVHVCGTTSVESVIPYVVACIHGWYAIGKLVVRLTESACSMAKLPEHVYAQLVSRQCLRNCQISSRRPKSLCESSLTGSMVGQSCDDGADNRNERTDFVPIVGPTTATA